ncbi:MAG TPA: hypothetical protein PLR90_01520 [Methylophilus sp.]|nr:hypothetical protein [Methylophilus sp.]HQQ32571.1 hypothetical protein [Methylophilus sp.]
MEHFKISQQGSSLHIDGFPDAVKVIGIDGRNSKRLADLALHKDDLKFADGCLDAINLSPEEPFVIREALWRSAIVHFIKCFGDSKARFQLSSVRILKGEPPEAMTAFEYFKHLRNKHLVHDENSHSQSLSGALLKNGTKNYKIEKVVCLATVAGTLSQENYGNLKLLIQKSRSWVITEFDQLCNTIATELESVSYDDLLKRKSLEFQVPTNHEIDKNRMHRK